MIKAWSIFALMCCLTITAAACQSKSGDEHGRETDSVGEAHNDTDAGDDNDRVDDNDTDAGDDTDDNADADDNTDIDNTDDDADDSTDANDADDDADDNDSADANDDADDADSTDDSTDADDDADDSTDANDADDDADDNDSADANDDADDADDNDNDDADADDADADADDADDDDPSDLNGDGTLNILVIGTNVSIKTGAEAFSPDRIAVELQNILDSDPALSVGVNVVAEDIHRTETITSGIAGVRTLNLNYHRHSLLQYYHWPTGHADRMANLAGENGVDWDYVVIGADPHIVATIPGYYALGAHKIAAKVAEGQATPLLLMTWPEDDADITHFEEFTYRTADGAAVPLKATPAGLAWKGLPDDLKDTDAAHPTPNGAYLAAATLYAQIFRTSATSSAYVYDARLADAALAAVLNDANEVHYSGPRTFESPFKACDIGDDALVYNHGGTSTENGILRGLQTVVAAAGKTLRFSAESPIHFNYGRSSMGSTHLYSINGDLYDFSLGYPLQDDASTGATSMLYGLDKRVSESDVETDLGVALHMVRRSELPHGRTVPLRTLVAQMLEGVPGFEIYSDNWHMSSDLNTAIASYMITLLTGDCAMEGQPEPQDQTSAQWRTWMAHKVGHTTAWTLMHMESAPPCYDAP